jgi:hypothetical protein
MPANKTTIASVTPRTKANKFVAMTKPCTGLRFTSAIEVFSFMPANGDANGAPHGHA